MTTERTPVVHLPAADGPWSLCGTSEGPLSRSVSELDCWLCATIAGIDLEEVDQ